MERLSITWLCAWAIFVSVGFLAGISSTLRLIMARLEIQFQGWSSGGGGRGNIPNYCIAFLPCLLHFSFVDGSRSFKRIGAGRIGMENSLKS